MNDKIILTDVDGCLLNWSQGFMDHMTKKGRTRAEGTRTAYRLTEWYPGYTEKEIDIIVNEFNTSPSVGYLKPWKNAVEYVKKLKERGYIFICVTSMSDEPKARFYREQNLLKVFGDGVFNFDEMVCLPLQADKHLTLKKWADSGYFWIEDHFKHAESGYELGLTPILMDNDHNQHFSTDLFPRVQCWEEIYNMVVDSETRNIHIITDTC